MREKETEIIFTLIEKLMDVAKLLQSHKLNSQLKDELLLANSFIKQHNFKTVSKSFSNLLRNNHITKE